MGLVSTEFPISFGKFLILDTQMRFIARVRATPNWWSVSWKRAPLRKRLEVISGKA